jgi:hypothetical protein
MASVILPTVRWTAAAETVVAGLRADDELFVVCDSDTDPVVDAAPPEATVIAAGEPVGCSGKANALAAGMEAATDDIVVWTDDDVDREEAWLTRLVTQAEKHDAATEVPIYLGGRFWQPFEPAVLMLGSVGQATGGYVWGGGVAFDRTELDEESLLSELRQTVGDDSLLSEYVDDVWADTEHSRRVRVDGAPRNVYHRLVRFGKTAVRFEPRQTAGLFGVSVLFAAGSVALPIVGAVVATLCGLLAYRFLGVRRRSVLLSFPSLLLVPLLLFVGVVAPTFEWGGRTYSWGGKFDVTVDP